MYNNFLGEVGGAGKTTLVHKLLTGDFSNEQFTMTDGVEMKDWKFEVNNNNNNNSNNNNNKIPVHLSLWDFVGQVYVLLFS